MAGRMLVSQTIYSGFKRGNTDTEGRKNGTNINGRHLSYSIFADHVVLISHESRKHKGGPGSGKRTRKSGNNYQRGQDNWTIVWTK